MRSVVIVMLTVVARPADAPAQALKVVEKVVEAMARQEGRQAVGAALRVGAGHLERRLILNESDEVAQMLSRRSPAVADEAALARRFDRLQGVNESLRAEFRSLPVADRRLVVELGEGAQNLLRRMPADEGMALLQQLDAGGLAQARTYGDFVFDGAQWLRSDEVAQALTSRALAPEEVAALTRILKLKGAPEAIRGEDVVPLWRSVVRRTGEGAGKFWKADIEPHKAKWLAGGLLITYLVMPEKFHDAAGNLTEYAIRNLSEMGVSVASAAGRGAVNGPIEAFQKRYADDPAGTLLGLALAVTLLLLAVPAVRHFIYFICRLFASLLRHNAPAVSVNTAGFQRHEPLRE